jgi:hypothetical protein
MSNPDARTDFPDGSAIEIAQGRTRIIEGGEAYRASTPGRTDFPDGSAIEIAQGRTRIIESRTAYDAGRR